MKQAQKVLLTLTPDNAEYQIVLQDIHNAEVDLNYTMYHPLDEKYRSLYPPKVGDAAEDDGRMSTERIKGGKASRPVIWTVVEQCMSAGTLIALRDGKLGRKLPEYEVKAPGPNTRRPGENITFEGEETSLDTGQLRKDEENESDGGFFET